MNTTVATVGPWCAGKTTFLNYVQQKFSGKTQADLVFPVVDKQQKKVLTRKRNAALDDPSLMYEFLTHYIQNSARITSTAFQVLGPRQFLFTEQPTEYLEVTIQAARNVKLISHFQWCLLRTLLDEMAPASVANIFVLFSNEDYGKCNNSHRRTGRSEHRIGAPLQKWNAEMERLHAEWVLRQRARGKIIFDVNARISKFSLGLRVKKLLNVVFQFSNKTHGTAFSQFRTAEKAHVAGEFNTRVLIPKVLIQSWRQGLYEMPPKRRSESPRSGTMMEEMDVEGLHEDTVEYQRRVQGMIEANRRGIPPQATSAGLPGFHRQGGSASGPSQGTRGRGRSAPPRRETQPFIDGRDRYGHPYEVQTRIPPRREPNETDVSRERAALLRRLAELDEGQGAASRRPSSVPPGGSRPSDYHRSYEPRQEPRYQEREPVFRRQDQERMSDANIKSEMKKAASRMLSSAFGSDSAYVGGGRTEYKEADSDKEIVSEDSSGDDSDTLERKRKARLRNKDREAKRRRKEDLVLIPALRPDYRSTYHHEEDLASSAGYRSDDFRYPQDSYYDERDSYYDEERGSRQEEGSAYWSRQGRDQRRPSPQPSQSWAPQRDRDHRSYDDEHRHHDQDTYGVEEEGEVQDDEKVSLVLETQQKDSPKSEVKPAPVKELKLEVKPAPVKEPNAKMRAQRSAASTAAKTPTNSVASSASKSALPRPQSNEDQVKRSKPLPPPEAPAKRISKRKVSKASPDDNPQSASGGKKQLVTIEEMETALSNIKTEKTTPPKMTDTMMSTELKKYLLSNINDEMDLEMDVPASQHFPQLMRQSPEALSSLLPKLHAKVFQAPHPPEDTRSSSVVSPPQASSSEANRSVSLSQDEMDEIERMEEWDDDEANEEMKIVLRASKRSAILEDEERRRAAWAALDMPVPGSSSQGAAKEGASSAKVAPSSAPAHSAKEESLKRKAETSAKKPAGAQPGTGTDKSSKTQQTGKEVPVEVKRSRTGSRTKAKADDGKEDNGRKVPGKIAPKKKEKEESATKKKEKEEVAPKKKEKEEGGDPKKE